MIIALFLKNGTYFATKLGNAAKVLPKLTYSLSKPEKILPDRPSDGGAGGEVGGEAGGRSDGESDGGAGRKINKGIRRSLSSLREAKKGKKND